MSEVLSKIVAFVAENGGKAEYGAIVESLDFSERQRAYNALREGKSLGVLKKYVAKNAETGVLETVVESV